MLYLMKNSKVLPMAYENSAEINVNDDYITINKLDGENTKMLLDTISVKKLNKTLLNTTPRFESYDNLDIICINLTSVFYSSKKPSPLFVFLQKKTMQFVCENENKIEEMLNNIFTDDVSDVNFGRVLHSFFEHIFLTDHEHLEKIEAAISKLEEDILINKMKANQTKKIISLRKHLNRVKTHYEQFIDMFSYIDMNENGYFDKQTIKYFRILQSKVNRLYNKVLNLRDYVTQIREAYQAEVDINLNATMKLLTVITIIFMPLTLLVGWYGMNLQMPEFSIPFAYPIVIGVSITIVVFCIVYFKKNKWF